MKLATNLMFPNIIFKKVMVTLDFVGHYTKVDCVASTRFYSMITSYLLFSYGYLGALYKLNMQSLANQTVLLG